MQTIEFETIAHGHTIRIPDTVPDGVLGCYWMKSPPQQQ